MQPRQAPATRPQLSASARRSFGFGPTPPRPAQAQQQASPAPQQRAADPASNDPNAQLYHVTVDPKTGELKHMLVNPKDIKAKNATIFINGISNPPGRAAQRGFDHTHKSDFYLIHNPTQGFFKDVGESAVQKLGFHTKVANSTRDLLRHFDLPSANVTAHSQGTLILNNALSDLRNEGKNMRGMNLNYHGAAANALVSGVLAHRIGANIKEFKGHPLDPVHNIVGMNTINPLRIAGSIAGAGLMFSKNPEINTHSKPAFEQKRLGTVFKNPVFGPMMPTHFD